MTIYVVLKFKCLRMKWRWIVKSFNDAFSATCSVYILFIYRGTRWKWCWWILSVVPKFEWCTWRCYVV